MNETKEPEAEPAAPTPDETDVPFEFAPGTEHVFDGRGFADTSLTTGGKLDSLASLPNKSG